MQAQNEERKLEWMYKGANSLVNREDYLLGKPIDRALEQLNDADKQNQYFAPPKNHVEHECIPPSIREFNKIVQAEQVDISAKLQEDPLVAIKKREEESRRQFLQNPVQLKKLQKALEAQNVSKSRKSKKKKKKKHLEICSDDDLDTVITKKLQLYKQHSMNELKEKFSSKKKSKKENYLDIILIHKYNQLKEHIPDGLLQDIVNDCFTDSSKDDSDDSLSDITSKNKKRTDKSEKSKPSREETKNRSRSNDVSLSPKRSHSSHKMEHNSRDNRHRDNSNYSSHNKKDWNRRNYDEHKYMKVKREQSDADEKHRKMRQRERSSDSEHDSRQRKHEKELSSKKSTKRSKSSESYENDHNTKHSRDSRRKERKPEKRRSSSSDESDKKEKHRSRKIENSKRNTDSKNRSSSRSSSEEYSDEKEKRRQKKQRKETESSQKSKNRRKSRKRSRSSSSENSDDEKPQKHSKINKDKKKSHNTSSEESSDSDCHRRKGEDKAKSSRRSDEKRSHRSPSPKYENKNKGVTEQERRTLEILPRADFKEKTYRSSSEEREIRGKKNWGLQRSDGSKIAFKSTTSKENKEKSSKIESSSSHPQHKKTKRLTEEEKERLRLEMMKNAEWRESDRAKNIKLFRESDKKEAPEEEFDTQFIQKELLKSTATSSVESRIKSNINNIQRSSRHMDSNFSRRH